MPQRWNSNQLSVDQIKTILDNDRIRQHLIRAGYIDHRGNVIPMTNDTHQITRPSTAKTRQSDDLNSSNDQTTRDDIRFHSSDSNSNDRQRRNGSRNQSRKINKSPVSARVQTVLLRRAVSPQILPEEQQCMVTLKYYGPDLNIEYDREYFEPEGDEVVIMQQHCGGENHLAFRGFLQPNESFSFKSRRHTHYPFAFSFYWNGVMKDRLSICCEYRCIHTMRVGGKRCLMAIIKVENAKPCRRCRFEQRMKQLLEQYPRTSRIGSNQKKSKSPSSCYSRNKRKESERSSSESPDALKKNSSAPSIRKSSLDSTDSDSANSKPTPSSTKETNHHQKLKSDDLNVSGSEKDKDSNRLDSDTKASHKRSSDPSISTTLKTRSPSPKPVESDVSDAEPPSSNQKSSKSAKPRLSSPQSVESIPSSPELPVFSGTSSSKLKKGPPSPQPIDSDSPDSESKSSPIKSIKPNNRNPPPIEQVESDSSSTEPSSTNQFHLPDPKEKPKSSSPLSNLRPLNESNRVQSLSDSSNTYDVDSEKRKPKPHTSLPPNDKTKSKNDSSSDSSDDNVLARRRVPSFAPHRNVPNRQDDSSSDNSENKIRRHPTRLNLQKDDDD